MAESRNSAVPTTTNANGTSTTVTNQLQTGVQSSQGSSSSRDSKVADYLDPVARAALNKLLASISDPKSSINQYSQERLGEINTNQQLRGDYSKAAAFADAIGAMNSQLSKGIEQQMPTITAGIDAAGTSGSAMSALLTRQAATDAANNAAELGLQAAIQYGQIQTGFGDILERLTASGDPATNQLLGALNIAKGASEISSSSSSSSQRQSGTSSQTTTGTSTTTEAKKVKEENTNKGGTGYVFQKFPDMSTPGYKTGSSSKNQGNTSAQTNNSVYKGAYGF